MLLKISVILVVSVILALSIYLFNRHCATRFKYRFFTMRAFLSLCFSLALLMAGLAVRIKGGDDGDLPGYLLIGLAFVVFWWILYLNFTQTNLLYGAAGTVGQLALFSVLAYAGIFSAVMIVGVGIAILSFIRPVHVVNRKAC